MKAFIKSAAALLVCAVLSLMLFERDCIAVQKVRIALLEFKSNNTSQDHAGAVRDILEVHLFRTGAFDLIERNQIDVILREQGFEKERCVETGCAISIGKVLSVDYVVVGSVSRMENFNIVLKFIKMSTGNVVYADSEMTMNRDNIEDAVNVLAKRSADGILRKINYTYHADGQFAGGYYLRGIVPGWAQWSSGHNIKAGLFFSGFLLAGAYAGYAYTDFREKRDSYEGRKFGDSYDEYIKSYEESDKAMTRTNIALYALAGVYVLNWIDVIFFSRPQEKWITMEGGGKCSIELSAAPVVRDVPELRTRAGIVYRF